MPADARSEIDTRPINSSDMRFIRVVDDASDHAKERARLVRRPSARAFCTRIADQRRQRCRIGMSISGKELREPIGFSEHTVTPMFEPREPRARRVRTTLPL